MADEPVKVEGEIFAPGASTDPRWKFLRDVAAFELKLALNNIHNFIQIPLTLAVALVDVDLQAWRGRFALLLAGEAGPDDRRPHQHLQHHRSSRARAEQGLHRRCGASASRRRDRARIREGRHGGEHQERGRPRLRRDAGPHRARIAESRRGDGESGGRSQGRRGEVSREEGGGDSCSSRQTRLSSPASASVYASAREGNPGANASPNLSRKISLRIVENRKCGSAWVALPLATLPCRSAGDDNLGYSPKNPSSTFTVFSPSFSTL